MASGKKNCTGFRVEILNKNHGVILGNVFSEQNISLDEESQEEESISSPMKLQFDGSVWADLNNDHEWIIENFENKMSAKLSPDAILRNGLYYGKLDNHEMKIGQYQIEWC